MEMYDNTWNTEQYFQMHFVKKGFVYNLKY